MNKQILSLAIPLVSIALPAILASIPALADNSHTQLQINATQPVVAAPIFSNNAGDRVMRRKGTGPGGIPQSQKVNNDSVINITNDEVRERRKPKGPGGKPPKVNVDGTIVINGGTGDTARPKPKGPGGFDAIPVINGTILAPGQ